MSDLIDFLSARIAEDEPVARFVQTMTASSSTRTSNYEVAEGSAAAAHFDLNYSEGGYTITAARALAECEAKRRIIEHVEPDPLALSPGDEYVLRLLAQVYADHPDYREEWRM